MARAELKIPVEDVEAFESEEERPVRARVSSYSLFTQISCLLFASPRPLSPKRLSEITGKSEEQVTEALYQVKQLYKEDVHGFVLEEVAGGFQLRTNPDLARLLHELIPPRARRLSRAAAETLAVVAYKQPVQRAEIESIRGVDALPTLKTLLDARLIRVIGHEDSVGRPALYGTTETFLEKFGLKDLTELPQIRELVELAEDPGEPAELKEEAVEEEITDELVNG